MPDTPYPQNGDPATALWETQQTLLIQGHTWTDGLDASLTSGLNLSLTSGTTTHNGSATQHGSQTVALPDSDPADPRWDLVVATPSGVQAIAGDADSVANYPDDPQLQLRYGDASRMGTPIPTLPDMSSVYASSGERPVALWAVWRPAGADAKGDLVDSAQHLFDRRIERSATLDQAGSLVSGNDYTVNSLQATSSIDTEQATITGGRGPPNKIHEHQIREIPQSFISATDEGDGTETHSFDLSGFYSLSSDGSSTFWIKVFGAAPRNYSGREDEIVRLEANIYITSGGVVRTTTIDSAYTQINSSSGSTNPLTASINVIQSIGAFPRLSGYVFKSN